MKIKHIYITKEGEPMANPEMEYPTEPIEDDDGELILNDSCPNCHTEYDAIDAEYQICHLCKFDSSHEAELQRYHSGLLPFEDAKQVKLILASTRFTFPVWLANILPIDLEVEVVEKYEPLTEAQYYGEANQNRDNPLIGTKRKVLRIKP